VVSMTGYAYREHQDDVHHITIELKSYNNRYLDIWVNVPSHLGMLEPRIRDYLAARVRRGKIELTLRYRKLEERIDFTVDEPALRSFVEALRRMCDVAGIGDEIRLSHLLHMDDLMRSDRSVDPESVWSAVEPMLRQVHAEFAESRVSEGAATRRSIESSMEAVAGCLEAIAARSSELESLLHTGVRERFEQVLGTRLDEDRVLAETAVLLVKFSIEEEISRLSGHLRAFQGVLESDSEMGKKLDFLCQELNREFNTIGSKSPLYEINKTVVDAKDAIEKIREQVRNIE
jgi:uncharacterized protein (TIGR00255 family)